METELIIKDKVKNPIVIQHDDLKFDGKNITIPGYYVDIILDYISDYNLSKLSQADLDDHAAFRNFLLDIQEHKNQGN